MIIGISGARRNAAVSLCLDGQVVAFCEQERVTRVRRVGLTPDVLPAEALETVLGCVGGGRRDVELFATGERGVQLPTGVPVSHVDHHRAHAAVAFHLSPFEQATVLVADSQPSAPMSVWGGTAQGVEPLQWPNPVPDFAALYGQCAGLFGFSDREVHELEGLARLDAGAQADRLAPSISYRDGILHAAPVWRDVVAGWLGSSDAPGHRARVAASFQRHLGTLLLSLVADIQRQTGARHLCMAGGLFYNTYFTTLIRQSGLFKDVFTPPNPGTAGAAIGAALIAAADQGGRPGRGASPFLGPEFSTTEIKATLDNCKLSYECLTEGEIIETTTRALARGQLVGWFQGRMEWGHRALGHRSILASPLSPYVLDNLNVYLKHRPRHRTYGVSVPLDRVPAWFERPGASAFMEYEFTPLSDAFRHLMPPGLETLRVQTVASTETDVATSRFARLHETFGEATGVPVLVNTSFNGFLEPMVCSPRDAVRVFFGSGLDLLVLDRFVVRK